jgi:uncharacterized protein YqeY
MILVKLKEDLKQAMKDKDTIKKGVLQLVITAINNAAKIKKADLDESEMLALIQKELKQTNEALEMFKKGNREDLVKESEIKVQILNSYLPKQMDETEIESVIRKALAENTISNKGELMKIIMPIFKGKADGKLVNQVVSKIYQ